jgi:hypothetical protein
MGLQTAVPERRSGLVTGSPVQRSFPLASPVFFQQRLEQLGIHAEVRVAQALKRLWEVGEAAACAIGQHAQRSNYAQVPSFRFQAGIPFVYQSHVGSNLFGQSIASRSPRSRSTSGSKVCAGCRISSQLGCAASQARTISGVFSWLSSSATAGGIKTRPKSAGSRCARSIATKYRIGVVSATTIIQTAHRLRLLLPAFFVPLPRQQRGGDLTFAAEIL